MSVTILIEATCAINCLLIERDVSKNRLNVAHKSACITVRNVCYATKWPQTSHCRLIETFNYIVTRDAKETRDIILHSEKNVAIAVTK